MYTLVVKVRRHVGRHKKETTCLGFPSANEENRIADCYGVVYRQYVEKS